MSGMSLPVPAPRVRKTVGYTVEVAIGGESCVMTVGHAADGVASFVDLRAGAHGSRMAGVTEALATAITVGLRHGAPAAVFADALRRIDLGRVSGGAAHLLADALLAADAAGRRTPTARSTSEEAMLR